MTQIHTIRTCQHLVLDLCFICVYLRRRVQRFSAPTRAGSKRGPKWAKLWQHGDSRASCYDMPRWCVAGCFVLVLRALLAQFGGFITRPVAENPAVTGRASSPGPEQQQSYKSNRDLTGSLRKSSMPRSRSMRVTTALFWWQIQKGRIPVDDDK